MSRRLSINHPKTLLEFDGKTILERSIYCLNEEGINDFLIVTGYKKDKIYSKMNEIHDLLPNIKISYIHNRDYFKTNNIYSLWLAKDFFKDGFILLNCDVLFHPKILKMLMKSDYDAVLAIDDYNTELEIEETKVIMKEYIIKKIDKEIDPKEADGEYIGISKFTRNSVPILIRSLNNMINEKMDFNRFYTYSIQQITENMDVYGVSTLGLPWIEIDTKQDLEKARTEVYPSICKLQEID